MRLLGTLTSPYVRKVRVVAEELGLGAKFAFEPLVIADQPAALDANPLRKVPTLITADGVAIYDSPVIMEWLDAEHGNNRLLPTAGKARWDALTMAALADGILEAGALIRTERAKPEGQQSAGVIKRQTAKIEAALWHLETHAAWRTAPLDLGQIAAGVAVAWLHFRLPEFAPPPTTYPGLAAWADAFAKRPSMVATAPPPGS
ncbi:MAG: glutathione S-transferase N-terminal domain-containing protein [Bauldia sp.]